MKNDFPLAGAPASRVRGSDRASHATPVAPTSSIPMSKDLPMIDTEV
jgi:hypothetical protein